MTKREKEKRKTGLITECLNIFMLDTIFVLDDNVKKLVEKYFPKYDIFLLNSFREYFETLRTLVIFAKDIDKAVDKYKD